MGTPREIRAQKLTLDTEDGYVLHLERVNDTTSGVLMSFAKRQGDELRLSTITVNGRLVNEALKLLGVIGQ